MNPADTFKILAELNRFKSDHPKAVAFVQSLTREGLQEGTVVEMKMTAPDGTEKICNLRVNEKDIALVALLRELGTAKP
ncbi:MAG: hypothetical protein IJQ21_10655 [Lachnospiraceae bacterium]|nr:hypothetical protein [Lachnospiraceae bacterium]